jgi:periplasmic protein TonB
MVSHPLPVAATHPGAEKRPKGTEAKRPAEDTFTKALLELPCEYRARNPLEWIFSFTVHILIVAGLLIMPLMFTQAIDLKAFRSTWLVAPAPPAPPPPPAAPVVRVVKSVARLLQGGKMIAPSVIPRKVSIIKEEQLPPDTGTVGVVGGVPGGIPGGQMGGVLGGIIGSTGGSSIAPPPPPQHKIVRVGGNLLPPRQLYAPQPQYPVLAKQAKVQGTVIIDAIIDEQGNIVQAHVVSGPGLLIAAALQAVSGWKYQPTRLNGEPISVEMHVEVHFVLQ